MSEFHALEQKLEIFVETVRQIGITVSDFQPNSQAVLNSRMSVMASINRERTFSSLVFSNAMIDEMRQIYQMKFDVEDVNVPIEVLEWDTKKKDIEGHI